MEIGCATLVLNEGCTLMGLVARLYASFPLGRQFTNHRTDNHEPKRTGLSLPTGRSNQRGQCCVDHD